MLGLNYDTLTHVASHLLWDEFTALISACRATSFLRNDMALVASVVVNTYGVEDAAAMAIQHDLSPRIFQFLMMRTGREARENGTYACALFERFDLVKELKQHLDDPDIVDQCIRRAVMGHNIHALAFLIDHLDFESGMAAELADGLGDGRAAQVMRYLLTKRPLTVSEFPTVFDWIVMHGRSEVDAVLDGATDEMVHAWLDLALSIHPHTDFSVRQRQRVLARYLSSSSPTRRQLKDEVKEMLIADFARNDCVDFVYDCGLFDDSTTHRLRLLAGLATGGHLSTYRLYSAQFQLSGDDEVRMLCKSLNMHQIGERLFALHHPHLAADMVTLSEFDHECLDLITEVLDRHVMDLAQIFGFVFYAAVLYNFQELAARLFGAGYRLPKDDLERYVIKSVTMVDASRLDIVFVLAHPVPNDVADNALAVLTSLCHHAVSDILHGRRRNLIQKLLKSTWTFSQPALDACYASLFWHHQDDCAGLFYSFARPPSQACIDELCFESVHDRRACRLATALEQDVSQHAIDEAFRRAVEHRVEFALIALLSHTSPPSHFEIHKAIEGLLEIGEDQIAETIIRGEFHERVQTHC